MTIWRTLRSWVCGPLLLHHFLLSISLVSLPDYIQRENIGTESGAIVIVETGHHGLVPAGFLCPECFLSGLFGNHGGFLGLQGSPDHWHVRGQDHQTIRPVNFQGLLCWDHLQMLFPLSHHCSKTAGGATGSCCFIIFLVRWFLGPIFLLPLLEDFKSYQDLLRRMVQHWVFKLSLSKELSQAFGQSLVVSLRNGNAPYKRGSPGTSKNIVAHTSLFTSYD